MPKTFPNCTRIRCPNACTDPCSYPQCTCHAPQAAHAATDVGADDKTPDGSGIVWAVMMGLAVWAVVATAAAVWVRV